MQYDVRCVEHRAEEVQLVAENLKKKTFGFVVFGDEVNDRDVVCLTVSVAPSDSLLDPLRIPRKVVVDQSVTELKVQSFCAGLG